VEREPDPYWNEEQLLGVVHFGHAAWHVHARTHIATERFRGRGSETIFTLSEREGERTYVQSRMFINAPPGTTREERVADAQAWWYPADRTLVMWEILPEERFRKPDPREDLMLRELWLRYEAFLSATFPRANRLLTTWEDIWEREQWQGFLSAIGYVKTAPAVFGKTL
jgi:hypothetical protein